MTTATKSLKRRVDKKFLATSGPGHVFTEAVGKLVVKPQEQSRLSLGMFSNTKPPSGFLVEIHSDTDNSVVAQMLPVGSGKRYELVLHVVNYGNKSVTIDVWRM